jgi:hypothetical protein
MKQDSGEYSLIPFYKTKSIFVHIPKSAGISICKGLYQNHGGGHTTLSEYISVFNKDEFDSFFKFTFVRNPWDRLYSAYTFLKNGGMNDSDREWAEKNLIGVDDFESFVIDWLNEKSIYSYIHFYPQCYFITIPETNDLLVDYIGYYENLSEDLEYVSRRLKINLVLEHNNQTKRQAVGYRKVYTQQMINKVALLYYEDINRLGYDF